MKTRTALVSLMLLAAAGLALPGAAQAQHFSLGSDLVSRYIWRGADFGESASVQPALAFSVAGFEIGTWASYSFTSDGAGANEHDVWVGYTVETATAGSFSVGVTDYYFPAPGGAGFFNFDGNGEGAHWIEPYVSYTGPEAFPVTLFGGMFVHNDPDNSVYLEASYPFKVDGVELGFTAGAVAGQSAFYGTEGFAFVNLGLSASRAIPITDAFSLPLSVAYILNPDMERSYLVFGLSF